MGKPVDSDNMIDALLSSLRARGVEISDEVATEACKEAYDSVDEIDMYEDDDYDDDLYHPSGRLADGTYFADPGGQSALRAATSDNPRNLPCPNCGEPDRLTPADAARGYQCNTCADQAERGW